MPMLFRTSLVSPLQLGDRLLASVRLWGGVLACSPFVYLQGKLSRDTTKLTVEGAMGNITCSFWRGSVGPLDSQSRPVGWPRKERMVSINILETRSRILKSKSICS